MPTTVKIYSADHHGVTTAAEVGGVFDFFGKKIAGVDDARDVSNGGDAEVMGLADEVFSQV